MNAVDGAVRPVRRSAFTRYREHIVVHRELDVLPRRYENGAVGTHELDVAARLAELGLHGEVALAALPRQDSELLGEDLCRASLERLVDRGAQLVPRDEVEQHRREHDRECDGHGRGHCDACAERHPSRSA